MNQGNASYFLNSKNALCNIQLCKNWKTFRNIFSDRPIQEEFRSIHDNLRDYFSSVNSQCLSIVIYFPLSTLCHVLT